MINSLQRITCSQYNELRECSIWLLCHLFSDTHLIRDGYINSKIYKDVINYFTQDKLSLSLLRYNLWFLSNFVKNANKEKQMDYEILMEILNIFANFINTQDSECLNFIIWGLYYISTYNSYDTKIYKDIINSGCLVKIMKINLKTNDNLQIPILKFFGNLCCGQASDIQVLLL
jgi:hypothetical protein